MVNEMKIGFGLLETITVALYENPIILFREYVQNSLDAYNRAIDDEKKRIISDFGVDIVADLGKKRIIIKDNGYGIEKDSFKDKMINIAMSGKDEDKTKYIGFRGIGRISGLPFCKKLFFLNKVENSDQINICVWEGDKYNTLIKEKSTDDIEKRIDDIVKFRKIKYKGKTSEHFFIVVLKKFNSEIEELLSNRLFKERLKKMLPLKYSSQFDKAKEIIERYQSFMKSDLNRFMLNVKYNSEELYKNYTIDSILESDIIFLFLEGKKQEDKIKDKIGMIWFTFDRHLKKVRDKEYFGILTRSKNMLMGSNDTFARVANECDGYITTYGEMVQALSGIQGELLINSPNLRDNARRDWFRYDEHSRILNFIIHDFMRRLHQYRYVSSRYYRKKATKEKEDLKKALDELISLDVNKINFEEFSIKASDEVIKESEEKKEVNYAEEDIPFESSTFQKIYNRIMLIIKEFFEKNNQENTFLRLRAFIVNKLKEMI
jgi:molecular chaperone HtpG